MSPRSTTRSTPRPSAARAVRLVALCALAAVGLTACGSSPVRAGAAAVVGDDRITSDQLARTVDSGLADPGATQLAADRPAYQRDVLSRLISADVVAAAAQREGVTVTASDVDSQYAQIESSVGGADQLRQQAGAAGLSLDDVRTLARTRALTAALGDRLTAGIAVPQSALQQAYQAGIDTYDQVRVAQIQLATLADAQALLPQARGLSDEDFEALARTRSLDDTTKANGGDLGYAPRSAFTQNDLQALGDAAFAAQPGATLAVASPRGGHVVRVIGRRTTTVQEAVPQLRRTILQQQRDTATQALLTRTATTMHIRINPRFGAWDASQLSVVARPDAGVHAVSSPSGPPGRPVTPADGLIPSQP